MDAMKPMQRAAYDELRRKPGFHPWRQFLSTPAADRIIAGAIFLIVFLGLIAFARADDKPIYGSCWGCMHGCTAEQNERVCGVKIKTPKPETVKRERLVRP